MATPSGTWSVSIRKRTKSKSVCDAAGKPTSISLKPIATKVSNIRSLRSWPMGLISAWLPSRRSTAHQTGGRVIVRLGHCRSGRSIGGAVVRYFCEGEGPIERADWTVSGMTTSWLADSGHNDRPAPLRGSGKKVGARLPDALSSEQRLYRHEPMSTLRFRVHKSRWLFSGSGVLGVGA